MHSAAAETSDRIGIYSARGPRQQQTSTSAFERKLTNVVGNYGKWGRAGKPSTHPWRRLPGCSEILGTR